MSRSLLQVVNQSNQSVDAGGIISLGTVLRRYGCNCRLSSNAIETNGEGYYKISGAIAVAPEAAGDVVVALYQNGVQIPGAIAYGTAAAAGDSITLPIETTIRQYCGCEGLSTITCVLVEGPSTVRNVSVRVEKD